MKITIDLDELAKQTIETRHEEAKAAFKQWIIDCPDTVERKEALCNILIDLVTTTEQIGFAEGCKAILNGELH